MTKRLTFVIAFLSGGSFAAEAWGQTVTNRRSGEQYTDLETAYVALVAGDVLEVTGEHVASLEVDRSVTIVGVERAQISTNSGAIFTLSPSVNLELSGLSLVAPSARAIDGASDNGLSISDCTIEAGPVGTTVNDNGGAIRLLDVRRAELTRVVFLGETGTPRAYNGGAIFATGAAGFLAMQDVTFDRIESTGNGGAVRTSAEFSCTGCDFRHTEGFIGGAISSDGANGVVEDSRFCGTVASYAAAIHAARADVRVHRSVFQQGWVTAAGYGSALYGTSVYWEVVNNHFVGGRGPSALWMAPALGMTVTNNLFFDNDGDAIRRCTASTCVPVVTYNWFSENTSNANFTLDASNVVDQGDPLLTRWTANDDCEDDDLRPLAESPLIDAGDPARQDPDGSRSDIGAYVGVGPDLTDADEDGTPAVDDCDDEDPSIHPGAAETCDQRDNDCDGEVDEGLAASLFAADCDGDGQGDAAGSVLSCARPLEPPSCGGSWVSSEDLGEYADADCDDTDAAVYSGARERCNGMDDDCNGVVDDVPDGCAVAPGAGGEGGRGTSASGGREGDLPGGSGEAGCGGVPSTHETGGTAGHGAEAGADRHAGGAPSGSGGGAGAAPIPHGCDAKCTVASRRHTGFDALAGALVAAALLLRRRARS